MFFWEFFFGTMWEDDEVSGKCSSCDLEIGGFHIQKDMYFWARAGQKLESSCWHKSAGEVMSC